jgi:hypothetical protein
MSIWKRALNSGVRPAITVAHKIFNFALFEVRSV